MTDPRVRLGKPYSGKLAGDLSAEIVATLSCRGKPIQERLPSFVLGGEHRFTVKPGGERLVDRRHAIQCHTDRAQYMRPRGRSPGLLAQILVHRSTLETFR